MQTSTALYISCTLVVLFQLFRWFGTTGEYLVGVVVLAHQLSLAYRLRRNPASSLSSADKAQLAFAFTYHAIISGINTYSLGQLFYANAELFGAGTWMWTAIFYAPIVLQTSFGIAECTLLVKIMGTTSRTEEEHSEVGEVYLPVTSPLATRFSDEKQLGFGRL
jgi:uncharacterized membrane protein YuzA (DUF378 family)